MNGSLVNKDIIGSIVGNNESKTLLDIEPLDGSRRYAIRKTPNAEGSVDG